MPSTPATDITQRDDSGPATEDFTEPSLGFALILQGLVRVAIFSTIGLTVLAALEVLLLVVGIYLLAKK
jgi:hypothetical protein